MKPALLVPGLFCVLIGFVWIGQGTGYFPYPASSFMVRVVQWAYYGAALAAIGLALIALSRRA